METQLLFDKLAYVDRLTKAGIDESQARAFSDALEEALRESVATKTDIIQLQHAIAEDIADVRLDMSKLEARLIRWNVGTIIAMTAVFAAIVKLL
jgi:hypothetical protein